MAGSRCPRRPGCRSRAWRGRLLQALEGLRAADGRLEIIDWARHEAALRAATRPAAGDALYFVAVGDGSGRHIFSTTLAEHNAAVARYLVTRRETLRKAEAP